MVEGVNNTNVDLQWEFVLDASESIEIITFERHKPEEVQRTPIAHRLGNNAFTISSVELSNEYTALLPATLRLLNVDQDEEFVYTLKVSYTNGGFNLVVSQVAIVIYGEYQLKHNTIASCSVASVCYVIECNSEECCQEARQLNFTGNIYHDSVSLDISTFNHNMKTSLFHKISDRYLCTFSHFVATQFHFEYVHKSKF